MDSYQPKQTLENIDPESKSAYVYINSGEINEAPGSSNTGVTVKRGPGTEFPSNGLPSAARFDSSHRASKSLIVSAHHKNQLPMESSP